MGTAVKRDFSINERLWDFIAEHDKMPTRIADKAGIRRDKDFWMAIIPAVLLLIAAVAAVFGFTLDLGELGNKLLEVVEAVFLVLGIIGIVNDPTTAGLLKDSKQALTYNKPKE